MHHSQNLGHPLWYICPWSISYIMNQGYINHSHMCPAWSVNMQPSQHAASIIWILTPVHVNQSTCWPRVIWPWHMSAMAHVDCSTCQLGYMWTMVMWTRHMSTFIHVNCHTGVHVNQVNGVDCGKCWLGHMSTSMHVDCGACDCNRWLYHMIWLGYHSHPILYGWATICLSHEA